MNQLTANVYTVIITDQNNCVYHDTIDLKARHQACLSIPNAFSPNGDNHNETWEIIAGNPNDKKDVKDMYPNATVEVFTRWGTLVYKSQPGYPEAWNGNYHGRPLPMDAYYYVLDPKDGSPPIKGTVTIVK
jgi:hypothetical protein